MKRATYFILGAAVGIIGYALADSPIDPFHDWIVSSECQKYYAKQFNVTPEAFTKMLEQMKSTAATTPAATPTPATH